MKPFNTLFYFLIGCTLFFCDCNSVSNYNEFKGTDSLVTLPFFNQPDWTPEWIKETDTGYNHLHTIPSFSFLDQNGMVVDEHLVNGKIYIANFFFTKCRNICPKMTNNLYLLQEEFKNDTSILLLSHSVTPETDDVNVLNKYALDNQVDAKKWHLLTGNKKEIYGLAKQQYFAGDTVGFYQSGNEFLHTENFILIDQHRRIRGVYNGTLLVEINRIKEDILILKSEMVSIVKLK